MSKYNWHIARKDEKPTVVRHYKWLTKMFAFVVRNPSMFKGKILTIYNHGKKVVDISWDQIINLNGQELKEGETRKIIKALESESE